MTDKEKAKAYDEVLEQAKKELNTCGSMDCDAARQIFRFFPQLSESEEDERIKGWILNYVRRGVFNEEEYPMALKAIEWLEKQKDASKAIEAVDRIDKYIDEHLANAHDMKDSNPDKKYYRGWDDALGKMAGILQDVYSGEKQKESLRDFIDDFPYSSEQEDQKPSCWNSPIMTNEMIMEKQKEQDWNKKPCLTCQEYEKGFKQGHLEGCTAGYNKAMKEVDEQKGQKPVLEVFGFKVGDAVRLKDGDGRKHIIKSFEEVEGLHGPNFYHVEFEDNSARSGIYPGEEYPNGFYTQMEKFEEEQKPAEWSEEDRLHYANVLEALEYVKGCKSDYDKIEAIKSDISWLKSLRPVSKESLQSWKPSKQEIDAFETALKGEFQNGVYPAVRLCELFQKLKKLCYNDKISQWKPSEEQMKALLGAEGISRASGYSDNAKVLASLYEELKRLRG